MRISLWLFVCCIHSFQFGNAFIAHFSGSPKSRCRTYALAKTDREENDEAPQEKLKGINQNDLDILQSVSRRNFVTWTAAGATLNALYNPALSSAKDVTRDDPFEQGAARQRPKESTLAPYSSFRQYKSVTLANGMRVLLVRDRVVRQSTAALTVGGAGQFSDPQDLSGLAHLMEHMILSSTSSRGGFSGKRTQDFEEWLSDYDGSSNGFTALEKVCFHFNCPTEVFSEALERFARLFLQEVIQKVCRDKDTLKREIRRINSELDKANGFARELYLVKALINQDHPYARMSAGNIETLETRPAELGIDVGQSLMAFFKERYQPTKAILVVISPNELSSLETWVAPFASTLSRQPAKLDEFPRTFPEFFPKQNRITTLCLFRRYAGNAVGEELEKLSFQWGLDLDYSDARQAITATQIGFAMSQIFGRKGPGSLYALLKRRKWIPEGSQGIPRISFPADVSGFQIMKLELSLTVEGFSQRSSVIAAVYDSINSLQSSPLSAAPFLLRRELISEYAAVAQLYGYVLAPRPPDAIELAFDGQVYGINPSKGKSSPEWLRFPLPEDRKGITNLQKCLQETLTFMSDPTTAIIIATASMKTIQFAQQNLFDNSLPKLSPASWSISPVTGARYYVDRMFRLSGKVNEWLVAKLMEDELSPPVINPLIPPMIRPARTLEVLGPNQAKSQPLFTSNKKKGNGDFPLDTEKGKDNPDFFSDPTKSSLVRDNWVVLQVLSHEETAPRLPLPRAPPEASCRCVFILQLISSRPARANVKSAAHAELWKISLEQALSDLVSFYGNLLSYKDCRSHKLLSSTG